jgi:hypothetical protein
MAVTVDRALSLGEARKVADDLKAHARGHLAPLETLQGERVPASRQERPEHHPKAEHEHHH